MTKPTWTVQTINQGLENWDADIATNFADLKTLIFDNPIPLASYASAGALPTAGDYEDCLAIADDGSGLHLYLSDGSSWIKVANE